MDCSFVVAVRLAFGNRVGFVAQDDLAVNKNVRLNLPIDKMKGFKTEALGG